MSNNELPNLSTWHRVPVGATIPAGTPYAYAYEDGLNVELGGYNCDMTMGRGGGSYYTEHPTTPPLPTEDGATIAVSSALMARRGRVGHPSSTIAPGQL